MTWADDGRATFQYGDEVQAGQPHIHGSAAFCVAPAMALRWWHR
jgi:hypothetical protein